MPTPFFKPLFGLKLQVDRERAAHPDLGFDPGTFAVGAGRCNHSTSQGLSAEGGQPTTPRMEIVEVCYVGVHAPLPSTLLQPHWQTPLYPWALSLLLAVCLPGAPPPPPFGQKMGFFCPERGKGLFFFCTKRDRGLGVFCLQRGFSFVQGGGGIHGLGGGGLSTFLGGGRLCAKQVFFSPPPPPLQNCSERVATVKQRKR